MDGVAINPGVSIIIPTYNSARYLPEALESAFNQTYGNIEIIVVNDGSTDDTRQIMDRFASRVTYIEQDNGGPARARNAGISRARGEYVAFLDADDLWMPHKLEEQMEIFRLYPGTRAVYCQVIRFDEASRKEFPPWPARVYSGSVFEKLLLENFISMPSLVAEASVLREIGGFDERLNTAEDQNLYMRIAYKYEIRGISKALVRRREHQDSLSERSNVQFGTLDNLDRIVQMFPDVRPEIYEPMKTAYVWRGTNLLRWYFSRSEYSKCLETCNRLRRVAPYDKTILGYKLLTMLPPPFLNLLKRTKRRFG